MARVAPEAPRVFRSSPAGMGEALPVGARQDHRLADLRQGQLGLEQRRGGGIGRHAGNDLVGDPQRIEPAHLLGDGAIERGIAGMDARDILALAPRRPPYGR